MDIKRVLVANRGEIALRVIRACRELGIESVAIYSSADRDSLHVTAADRAVCVGPRETSRSYLDANAILTAATLTEADAVHPGYGFLAENAAFADQVHEAGLTWVGPPTAAIRRMGDKSTARETMREAGVPVVPGSKGTVANIDEARDVAAEVGYPLLLKATAGGGGKGMRIVEQESELASAFEMAQSEARTAFGDDHLYVERLLTEVRHIEVQVLADGLGHAIHLWERDCSAQRRRQKLLEEAPAPNLPGEIRVQMGEAAVAAAQAVDYVGAGTVEFIYDRATHSFYFMEMNTRIQVEHPVTEMITGIDLVQQQLLIAGGAELGVSQDDVRSRGHAIECRINAESPRTFLPNAGALTRFRQPGGPFVRVDTHCFEGYTFPPFWDSLMAKLIVWAPTRAEALARMTSALHDFDIQGIETTIPFQLELIRRPELQAGEIMTHSVEQWITDMEGHAQ